MSIHGPERDQRSRRAFRGSIAGIVARVVAAAASLLTVPLLLGYLGAERYGVWVSAAALTAWVGLAHLGVPQSLLNVVAARGRDEEAARTTDVASAWWVSVLLAAVALAPILILELLGLWPAMLNASQDSAGVAGTFVIAMWIGMSLSMPLAIPLTVLRADQEVQYASAIEIAATAARVAAIVVSVSLGASLALLAGAAALAPLIVFAMAAGWVFRRNVGPPRLRLFERDAARSLLSTGVKFTGIAVAGLLITSADVIIVAQTLGPAVVPTYSVAFALLLLFLGLEMAVLNALWPAYTEAAAKHDRRWVARTNSRVTAGMVAASTLFGLTLLIAGQWFIERWAGPEAVPPQSLLLVFGLIAIVQGVLLPHGRILSAVGQVRKNTKFSLAGAAINIPVSLALASVAGVTGVAAGTLVAYLITGGLIVRASRRAIVDIDPGDVAETRVDRTGGGGE